MGGTIAPPGDLNLSQDQRVALEAEILKRVTTLIERRWGFSL